LENLLEPIQQKRRYFEQHGDELNDILRMGATRAKAVAEKTMEEVVTAIGFLR
jgi:tryptophanyl-tRNA synthetase